MVGQHRQESYNMRAEMVGWSRQLTRQRKERTASQAGWVSASRGCQLAFSRLLTRTTKISTLGKDILATNIC